MDIVKFRGNGKYLRNRHRKSKSTLPLKAWVWSQADLVEHVQRWFARKAAA